MEGNLNDIENPKYGEKEEIKKKKILLLNLVIIKEKNILFII